MNISAFVRGGALKSENRTKPVVSNVSTTMSASGSMSSTGSSGSSTPISISSNPGEPSRQRTTGGRLGNSSENVAPITTAVERWFKLYDSFVATVSLSQPSIDIPAIFVHF